MARLAPTISWQPRHPWDSATVKGIIFNLLEEVITQELGEGTWDQLLDTAEVDGSFTSLGNYPDADLFKLVAAASAALKQPPDVIVRWFGVKALPLLAKKYPAFFDQHDSTRSFILTLNGIIHPEVRKLYPGADTPEFDFDTSSPEVLIMNYRSKRQLCSLVEGFTEGSAAHFNETVHIEHPLCMHRGDACCRLELSFARKPIAG
jgi:hypothetical protein